MKQFLGVLFLLATAQASAAQYVGSADSGVAKGWPQKNSFYASGQQTQVFLVLNRTTIHPYTGETRGEVQFNVGYGEGHNGVDFYGTYIRQGNRLYFYFDGKQYRAARGARLVQRGADQCLSIVMSNERPPVLLCEGAIGA